MMKRICVILFLALFLSACQQAQATFEPTNKPTITLATTVIPTSELSPYYGEPQPAQLVVNGKVYDSGIGTTRWITEVQPDGTTAMTIGDAFAIITPAEPILTASNPSFILKFPISISPAELWYILYKVSEQELALQDPARGAFRWNPDYKTQAYSEVVNLPLLSEQQLTFVLEPGIYVLEVHVAWGGAPPHTELEADYGFLLEVQE